MNISNISDVYFVAIPLLTAVVVVVAGKFLVQYLWRYQKLRATFNKIPGPEDTFLLGNVMQVESESHRKF